MFQEENDSFIDRIKIYKIYIVMFCYSNTFNMPHAHVALYKAR